MIDIPITELSFLSIATLVTIFALHAHAREMVGRLAATEGLMVESGHKSAINNGVQGSLLPGVGNRPAMFNGVAAQIGTMHFPDDDLVGKDRGFGNSCSGQRRNLSKWGVTVSPGVHLSSLRASTSKMGEGRPAIAEKQCHVIGKRMPPASHS